MFLLTKLDEALILYKRKSGGSSSLVRRKSEGRAKEEGRKSEGKANCHKSIFLLGN
jgi:hypothetical protein